MINVILSVAGILNILISIVVLARGRIVPSRAFFSLLSFSMGLWALAYLPYLNNIGFDNLFWLKAVYVFGLVTVVSFFFFAFSFSDDKLPSPLLTISYLIINSFFVYEIAFSNDILAAGNGSDVQLGSLYGVLFAAWLPYSLLAINKLLQKFLQSTGLLRLQFLYLFAGAVFLTISVLSLDLVVPMLFGTLEFFPLSAASSIFFVGLTGYSILRHRLLDIRIALEGITQFLIKASIVVTFALAVADVNDIVNNQIFDVNILPLILIAAITFTLFFDRLGAWVKEWTDKYLFHSLYDYQTTLRDLSHSLANILDLEKLVEEISQAILQSLKAERIAVLILDNEGRFSLQKTQGFEAAQCWWLVGNNGIMEDMTRNRRILVGEELQQSYQESAEGDRDQLKRMIEVMGSVGAAVVIPVFNGEKLSAVIIVGERRSGNAFTVEDINLLSTVSGQFAIALENADLYAEVEEANRDLQKKIEAATAELRQKNSEIQKAFEDLKSLDVMKNQLIAVTSHELKTPATVVQNYLWVVLNDPDTETKLTDADKTKLQKSFNGIQNLIHLINDILNVSRIEGGKMAVDITDVEPKEVISQAIEDFMPKAEEKKLRLTFEPSDFNKKIRADKNKLYEVLTNLVSNAIKYTEVGDITVRIEEKDRNAVIRVSDTGRGIAKENFRHVFEKFYREDASLSASNVMTGGTGLGLYITKSYIDLMNGQIWVESEKGEGSTFSFSLPIA